MVLISLCGCATFQRENLSPDRTASDLENRTLDSLELKEFIESAIGREVSPWPQESWNLEMLGLAALYYHPSLEVARAQWRITEAGIVTAGQRPNPSVGFIPQYHANPGGKSPWTLIFSGDIPIETAGRRSYRISQARHLSNAAKQRIIETSWQVTSGIRKSFLNLYGSMQRRIYLKERLDLQKEIFDLLEKRLHVGEESRVVVTGAKISMDQMRIAFLESENAIAQARITLAGALGVQAAALDHINFSFDFLEVPLTTIETQDLKKKALLKRADVLSLLSEYEAAQSKLQLEIARQFPDFHLGPGYSWDQGDNEWSLGFSLTLPVLNRNEGPIAEAKARVGEIASRFVLLQAGIIGQIESTADAYRSSVGKLREADSLLSIQERRYADMQLRFSLGEEDRLALLAAGLELSTSRQTRLEAFIEVEQSLGVLEDALQHSFDSPAMSLTIIKTDRDQKE